MSYCSNCGNLLNEGDAFCGICGHPTLSQPQPQPKPLPKENHNVRSFVNQYVGNDEDSELNWRAMFSDVFTKHTQDQADDIFICGARTTTPPLAELSTTWPKPWLYARVTGLFLLAFFILNICFFSLNNTYSLPGLIIVGSFAVPLGTLVMFFEMNVYRNFSFYKVLCTFLLGGTASLLVTLMIFELGVMKEDNAMYLNAFIIGIVEEIGKLVIILAVMSRWLKTSNILPGMLVGAAVGTGFAAFESAGYAMSPIVELFPKIGLLIGQGVEVPDDIFSQVFSMMKQTIYLRGILSPGGHIAWAAITGAALAIASKSSTPTLSDCFTSEFLKLFIIPVVLHGLWDCPLLSNLPIVKYSLLIVGVWIIILALINKGLKEIKETI